MQLERLRARPSGVLLPSEGSKSMEIRAWQMGSACIVIELCGAHRCAKDSRGFLACADISGRTRAITWAASTTCVLLQNAVSSCIHAIPRPRLVTASEQDAKPENATLARSRRMLGTRFHGSSAPRRGPCSHLVTSRNPTTCPN